jgi:hypothetical protein
METYGALIGWIWLVRNMQEPIGGCVQEADHMLSLGVSRRFSPSSVCFQRTRCVGLKTISTPLQDS